VTDEVVVTSAVIFKISVRINTWRWSGLRVAVKVLRSVSAPVEVWILFVGALAGRAGGGGLEQEAVLAAPVRGLAVEAFPVAAAVGLLRRCAARHSGIGRKVQEMDSGLV